jgi:transposase-like protein
MNYIHTVSAALGNSVVVANKVKPCWGNVLVVDGTYVPMNKKIGRSYMCWITGVDYRTGDVPHYAIADEETMIDLVLFFTVLKNELQYDLKVLVCDGNEDIPRAARKVYGNHIIVQLCTRHFIQGLKRKAKDADIHDNAHTKQLMKSIQRVIEANTLNQAEQYLEHLKPIRCQNKGERVLMNDFKDHANELTTHIQYPHLSIPHTTNDIESLFTQLKMRTKTIRQFQQIQYITHYLNAWSLWRRTTPFTDCKGKRRYRNNKTPLDCANAQKRGVNIFFFLK